MANLDNIQEIKKTDVSGMLGHLTNFSAMVKNGIKLGKDAKIPKSYTGFKNILFTGLGGSAIGGDLLKSFLNTSLDIPLVVNRNYFIPKWVGLDSLVIVITHSGNTEESISAFKEAVIKKAKIIVITSGGSIKKLADENNVPCVLVPGGLPPRASLPCLFFTSLLIIDKLGLIKLNESELSEVNTILETLKKIYSPETKIKDNPAKQLASKLFAKPILLVGVAESTDAIATRWKCQFIENSKVFSVTSTIPEMNHNEIVSWDLLRKVLRKFAVIFLRDKFDLPQIKKRINLTKEVISKRANWVGEVNSIGESSLARIFSLIYLGDFVSFYLAILYGLDPTQIKLIENFKKELSKSK